MGVSPWRFKSSHPHQPFRAAPGTLGEQTTEHVGDLDAAVIVEANLDLKVMMGYEPMVSGFNGAVERLAASVLGDVTHANPVYAALFEASNWLVSIADRSTPMFSLNPLQRGIRFARNAKQHQWASAVEYAADAWRWRRDELLPTGVPDVEGRADYMQQLAGHPVVDAFLDLKPLVQPLAPSLGA